MSLISITFTSCEKWDEIWNGSPVDPSTQTHVTVNFTQTVNGVELTDSSMIHNSLIYTNSAGENYDVRTLKYIISNITLHGLWNDPGPNTPLTYSTIIGGRHFIDISNESTFSFTASLSPHKWTSISYTMGLDTGVNISDYIWGDHYGYYASMAWPDSLGGGYHYMKLEGAYNNNSTFYNTHTGGTMGGDYSFNHVDDIDIPRWQGDTTGHVSISINMEINNWYDSPHQIEFSSYGTGIMMDTTMQENIQQNGIADVFSVTVDK